MIEIDHRQLEPHTLEDLLTTVVVRKGAEYGVQETSLEDKKQQLRRRLDQGEAKIVFYAAEGFCDVVKRDDDEHDQN